MKFALFALAAITLAGCGGAGYSDDYIDDYIEVDEPIYDRPQIEFFELIDTFGFSSFDPGTPVLNPYEDDGWFQVNWEADTRDDYVVEYRVNDLPSITGSVLIDSETCGPGFSCGREGLQFCQYNADISMTCDADFRVDRSFDHKVFVLPQSLFFIIQLCTPDFVFCEYTFEEFTAE
ncbi:MAG: hypothetical protein KTR17_01680 [Cellvibrionaceae bacterium]|nr:hypothetical protein [Cellvibrionaceae bacterium]